MSFGLVHIIVVWCLCSYSFLRSHGPTCIYAVTVLILAAMFEGPCGHVSPPLGTRSGGITVHLDMWPLGVLVLAFSASPTYLGWQAPGPPPSAYAWQFLLREREPDICMFGIHECVCTMCMLIRLRPTISSQSQSRSQIL